MLPKSKISVPFPVSIISRIVLAVLALYFVLAPGFVVLAKTTQPSLSSLEAYDAASFAHELARLNSELEMVRNSSASLKSFRDTLPDAWTVKIGEQQYAVPTSPLTSRLDQAEKEPAVRELKLNEARDFLDALATESNSASSTPTADISSVKTTLGQILARPEFANRRQQSSWDRFRERISQIIYAALLRLLARIGGQKSMGPVLLWLGICAAAVLIAYWIFRQWFRAARMEEMALQSAGIPVRSWQQWVFSSRAAASEGDHRMAVHCAYWAGITRLQELGALSADRAKTPREYLRALTKSSVLVSENHSTRYQALSTLTTRLEKIWYGYHIATEKDFNDTLAQLEVLGCHLP